MMSYQGKATVLGVRTALLEILRGVAQGWNPKAEEEALGDRKYKRPR